MNEIADRSPKASEPIHPMVQFKRDLEAMVIKELDMLDEKSRSRMKSAAIVAVTKDPELLAADRSSFMMAIRMCASHGVAPDGIEATLQTYNTKVKGRDGKDVWIKKVQYQPMVRGIINRVLRSGKVQLFWAELVYDGEPFNIDISHGDRRPSHNPNYFHREGEIIGAYAVAKMANGTTDCEPMPMTEIEKVRAVAKTQNVWNGWFEEKAKVAVMRRMSKRLPLSAEDMDFIMNRDEVDFDQPIRDVTPKQGGFSALAKSAREAEPVATAPESVMDGEVMQPEDRDTKTEGEAPAKDIFRTLAENGAPGSTAWDKGADAHDEGKPISDCPYDPGEAKQEAEDWCGGWVGAERAKA